MAAGVDRHVRGWEKASDHAPAWVDLRDAGRAPAARSRSETAGRPAHPRLHSTRTVGGDQKYTGRWNPETTFQECRSCLGLETTRGWCRATVLRAAPCLPGLYSVVAALYHLLPAGKRAGQVDWPGKAGVTFSDALTAVRRWLWADGVLPQAAGPSAVRKLPPAFREVLLHGLAAAA